MKRFLWMLAALMMVGTASVTMTSCGDDDEDNTPSEGGNSNSSDTCEYVDLGLPSGTLWATCNIGASSPEKNNSASLTY